MRLSESITEHKKSRRAKTYNIKPRKGHTPTQTGAGPHKDKKKAEKQGDVKHKKPADMNEERYRDPDDWDEGNTEPANNFAVYINGKKWKVFKGRGYYADDQRDRAHYHQLKDWAAKKSAATGKKWEVYVTGEPATD